MTNYSTLGANLKTGLLNFSKKVSKNFNKSVQKFIANMIFGMISANSCKLTDVGRALKEPIALKKTVERLGRNLSEFSEGEALMRDYLAEVKPSIGPDAMLLVDPGDVAKPCSPKMEAIGSVYDGSAGKFADGYWTMGAVALSDKRRQPIPVYENLYPCTKQGGLGLKAETSKCLQYLRENFDANVPRVFDRGFDSGSVLSELTGKNEKFILRVNQNRVAVHNGKRAHIHDVARGVVCETEMIFHSKSGQKSTCKIGMTRVTLPKLKNVQLNLVVCKAFGEDTLALYTNLDETLETLAPRVVKAYLMRWRIEEFYAFKKQGFAFEDFRVRGLNSIKNLDLLLTVAIGYIATLCEKLDEKLTVELIAASKRIPKISVFLKKTKFFFYAVLAGITRVLATLQCGIAHFFAPKKRDNQLSIPGLEILG